MFDFVTQLKLLSTDSAPVHQTANTRDSSQLGAKSFSEAYELGEMIGHGSFGQVFSCVDKTTKEEFACKVVSHSLSGESAHLEAQKEIATMKLLRRSDPGILQLKEVKYGPEGMPFLVMEKCNGGDLFELLKTHGPLPEVAAKHIFLQLTSALHACHIRGVVHRDIKPENVLLDRPALELYNMTSPSNTFLPRVQAKLADFGIATILPAGQSTVGIVGSKQYLAPEVVRVQPYGCKADMWSLGIVLYAMLSARLPFSGVEGTQDLFATICQGKVSFRHRTWNSLSQEAKDMVLWLLTPEPSCRPSTTEVLQHPWIQGAPAPTTSLPHITRYSPLRSLALEVSCQ